MDKETRELIKQGIIVCNDESVLDEELNVDFKKAKAYNKGERLVLGMKPNTINTEVKEDLTTEDTEIQTYSPEVRDGVIIITKDIMSKDEWDEWE